ncbi:hypothetical protein ABTX80_25035 [Streptomyces erythrochromogenes]|uniref:hypothetical protein n=1 Tax=Streptomyces erythrochromogenes TaxID=285574 RepID=UPI00332F29F0
MSHIMPGTPGDTNPEQLYPVTEAAELLLRGTGLHFRYNPAEAKRALRAAAEAGEVSVRRIDGRLAFAFSELDTPAAIDAFMARLKAGGSADTNPTSVLQDTVLAGLRAAAPSGTLADWTPEDLLAAFVSELVDTAVDAARSELTYRPETELDHTYNVGVEDAAAAIAKRFPGGAR